ncbi:MAG: hypothetical protein MUE74_03635 [Bacteroidales bacterium]|jgi:hypothetical protein|nr:hypothetical protein [Bacteroidales bacterium]
MKRKLLAAASVLFIAVTFSACEENCKICRQNTYVDGTLDVAGEDQEYCGASLVAIEAMADVKIGNTVTKWECD